MPTILQQSHNAQVYGLCFLNGLGVNKWCQFDVLVYRNLEWGSYVRVVCFS